MLSNVSRRIVGISKQTSFTAVRHAIKRHNTYYYDREEKWHASVLPRFGPGGGGTTGGVFVPIDYNRSSYRDTGAGTR